MPKQALQKLIAEVAESLLSVAPNNRNSEASNVSTLVQPVLVSDSAVPAEPPSSTPSQSIEVNKQQTKPSIVAATAGDIIDTVVVDDRQHKSKTTEQRDDAVQKIDPSASLNKQFVQALRLLHTQGWYVWHSFVFFYPVLVYYITCPSSLY